MGLAELYQRGAAHAGVVGPPCARIAGIRLETFLAMCRRQELRELRPRTFLLPGWPDNGAARTFATALSIDGASVVTGWGAIAQHGLTRSWPSTIEILLPANYPRLHLPGVRTRWTCALPDEAVVDVEGVHFTDVARSLAHLAGRTHLARLRALAFDALGKRLLTIEGLEREIQARGRFPGRGLMRHLVGDLQGDGSESGFEFDARERLTAIGLPPDADQASLRTVDGERRLDIAFGDHLVGIECLGFSYHSSPDQLAADVVRSNAIAELDEWLILRLTFGMFHLDWDPFVDQLRRCLATREGRRHQIRDLRKNAVAS